MNQIFEIAFKINAAFAGQSAFSSAQSAMKALSMQSKLASVAMSAQSQKYKSQMDVLNETLGHIEGYKERQKAVGELTQETARAKTKEREKLADWQAEQKQLERMKAAYEQFKNVRRAEKKNMSAEQYKVMGEQLKAMKSELKAQESAVKSAQAAYNSASAAAQKLNAKLREQQAALSSLRSNFAGIGSGASQLASQEAQLRSQIEQTTRALERQRQVDLARSNARTAVGNFGSAVSNVQGAADTARQIMSPFTDAISNAMDFEFAMSNVKALTQMKNITDGNIQQVQLEMSELTAEAERLGATTEYTATQAAQAMGYFGMAGFSKDQIMAATKSLLDLATATKTELPRAADVVSDLIQATGLKAGESVKIAGKEYESAAHFMDVFSYATTRANLNTESTYEAMKYSAPIAKQFGLSLHEMAAANMVTANSAIKGSMAGTAMRTGLLRLIAPPKMAAGSLDELGLSMSDARKQMEEAQAGMKNLIGEDKLDFSKSLDEGQRFTYLMSEMKKKFDGMGKDEMLSHINNIFGKNASSFWAEMFANFDQYQDYLKDMDSGIEGWSSRTAGVMRDNTKTQVELFKSAADAAQRSLGQVFQPLANQMLVMGQNAATGLQQFIQNHQTAVQWAGLLAAAVAAGTVAVAAGTAVMAGFRAAVAVATAAQAVFNAVMMANPIGLAVLGVIAFVAQVYILYNIIQELPGILSSVGQALSDAWNDPRGAVEGFRDLFNSVIDSLLARWETKLLTLCIWRQVQTQR